MQTFLPYPDFAQSAACLDYRRLGKQRVEAWQIYNALTRRDYGWQNHPATRMWRGHTWSLLVYGGTMCKTWIARGYNDNLLPRFQEAATNTNITNAPAWLGNEAFHSSHRAALLYKDYDHYSHFGWAESAILDYIWPVP